MIDEGVRAPDFELPALVEGEHERVALEEYVGEDVVVLTFYPADFNPACDVESDLDQLDLFTMQPDVSVLAVGPDTLFAHGAFADEYDLKIPLLADTKREVADAYDVAYEDGLGQSLVARAVFVVDHDGEIVYAWSTRDPSTLANVDEIKDALGDTGGDDTAFSRYRVGHAHYVEGRRAFTTAMEEYGDSEWMMAQSDYQRAREEFEAAEEHFTSAARFVDSEVQAAHYDQAREKVTALWQAADWLARSASEYSSGAGSEGQQLRDDAERPLEEARAIAEPVDPDDWPPGEPPPEPELPDDTPTFKKDDENDDELAALGVDIDEDASDDATTASESPDDAGAPDASADEADGATANGDAPGAGEVETVDDEPTEDDIDDEELAEIEAEIAANNPDEPLVDGPPEERRSVVDEPPEEESGDVDEADPDGVDGTNVEAVEDDLADAGGGSASLEPETGATEGPAGGEEASGDDRDDEPELEELSPESTSLDGIPSEDELADDADRSEDGAGTDDG